MNNRTTYVLAGITGLLLITAVVAGIITSRPNTPKAQENRSTQEVEKKSTVKDLSSTELANQLQDEQAPIVSAIENAFPEITNLYIINTGKLYKQGQWYATTLTYKGTDNDNRDTLRIVMKKENENWILITKTPQIIISKPSYPTIPVVVIDDVNRPESQPPASITSE